MNSPRPFAPRVLEALLGPEFCVEVAAPAIAPERLFSAERAYIAGAVPQRRAEFTTARVCARRALARVGVAPASLVPHPDRSPRWPRGVVGSISHTAGCCVVAVSTATRLVGLGIDVEVDSPLEPELEAMVCTAVESAWLDARPHVARGRLAKLLFSAKEAVYKCQYPTTHARLEFHDIEIAVDVEGATFVVAGVARAGAPCPGSLEGRFARPSGFLVSTAVWAHDAT